jgi:hypothetical protein
MARDIKVHCDVCHDPIDAPEGIDVRLWSQEGPHDPAVVLGDPIEVCTKCVGPACTQLLEEHGHAKLDELEARGRGAKPSDVRHYEIRIAIGGRTVAKPEPDSRVR